MADTSVDAKVSLTSPVITSQVGDNDIRFAQLGTRTVRITDGKMWVLKNKGTEAYEWIEATMKV